MRIFSTLSLQKSRSARCGALKGVLLGLLAVCLFAAIGISLAISQGAGSRSKADIRSEILALPKNAPFAAALQEKAPLRTGESALYAHFPPNAAELAGGARAPIVFVHGTPDTMGAWSPLLFGPGALAGKESIYTLEVIGHGIADAGRGRFPFQRCADHVASAIEALGLDGVTLVGNSYGAEFCWRAAADRPDLISKLVLIDSSGLPRTEDQFLSEEVKMRDWWVARYGYLLNSEERVAFALDPHFDGAADKERVRETFLGLENRGNWNAMIDLVRDENGERKDDLNTLQMPTLLIFGEHDQAYPPETFGSEFEERIPDARLHVIAGAGHYPHEQRPEEVAALILGFHRNGFLDSEAAAGSVPESAK